MSLLLEGEGLRKYFGGVRAVDGVDCQLHEEEILGVIGPNGAGKTTLFSVLGGALRPTAGRVALGGEDVTGWPAHRVVRRGLCRTHQVVRPFTRLTVLSNTLVGAYYGREGKKRTREARDAAMGLLDFVGLAERADDLPGQLTLSGRKRLEIARALATQPRVLLLDEVIAGLNPAEAQRTVQLIGAIRDRGIAVLMIEHVMHAVMAVSDRVMVLDQGKKIADGTPKEVANDPEVVRAYLGTTMSEDVRKGAS